MPDSLEILARRISEAPLAPESWPSVLIDVAEEAGGCSGQLFAVAGAQFLFDVTGGLSSDVVDELNRRGGADPAHSPRPRALTRTAPMTIQCDADYLSAKARDRFPIYKELFEPEGSHFATIGVLARGKDSVIGVAINHSAKQGAPAEEARKRLLALLPHLNAAVQLQIRMEAQATAFSLKALQALQKPAIVCDAFGVISAVNGLAEDLLKADRFVSRRNNKLMASAERSRDALQGAIGRCAMSTASPPIVRVMLHNCDGTDALVADVAPLPVETGGFCLGASVLVAFRCENTQASDLSRLLNLGLTHSEVSVAAALARGSAPLHIAQQRGVSIETVRSQIKSIHAKLGVRRNAELIERLRSLIE